jgi:SAM-dependent methyltransferase
MSENKIVNADQAEFWQSATGAQWVELQESLDNLLSGVLDHLLETAGVEPRQSVLDIGCGTGASVLALCERVGPDGMVEGLDISSQMLARARQRAQDAGLRNARLTLADAQVHPFERQLYDQVVSRFGVMFFSDTVAAFANIANAVKPGGRMTLASWGPLQENPWFSIPRAAAIAQLGEVPPVDPNAPGPMAFHDTERVLGLFRQAGLPDASVEVANVPLHPKGDARAAATVASNIGPASRILREKGGTPDDARAIADRVAVEFEKYVTPQGVLVPTQLNFYSIEVR